MLRLTRRYRFAASHRLYNPELTEPENRAVYGKCANPYGHGHNYTLEVSVAGPLGKDGRVVDPEALDRLVERCVLRDYANRNLNLDVAEYAATIPTSENVALEIERRLRAGWHLEFQDTRPALEMIRLFETRRNIVELAIRARGTESRKGSYTSERELLHAR